MINPIVKTIELADGRTITLETGKLAKQADGSVMLRMGNTMLLATVCAAKDAVPGTDFMPLQVEYKEKYSAFGRFPGGFTKREGKASDLLMNTNSALIKNRNHRWRIQIEGTTLSHEVELNVDAAAHHLRQQMCPGRSFSFCYFHFP